MALAWTISLYILESQPPRCSRQPWPPRSRLLRCSDGPGTRDVVSLLLPSVRTRKPAVNWHCHGVAGAQVPLAVGGLGRPLHAGGVLLLCCCTRSAVGPTLASTDVPPMPAALHGAPLRPCLPCWLLASRPPAHGLARAQRPVARSELCLCTASSAPGFGYSYPPIPSPLYTFI